MGYNRQNFVMKKLGVFLGLFLFSIGMYAASVGDECTYKIDGTQGRVVSYEETTTGSSWSGGGGLNGGFSLNGDYNSGRTDTKKSGLGCETETGTHKYGW